MSPGYCHNRGATAAELSSPFACDGFLADPDHYWFRAVDVGAAAATTFRWLTQLRVAPYSYDWIDNLGRQSPRCLLELPALAVGQRAMIVFEIVDFEENASVTLLLRQPWWLRVWAAMAVTYRVDETETGCRIVAKMRVRFPRTPAGWATRMLLPHGDWFMMRKQLETLRQLASATS